MAEQDRREKEGVPFERQTKTIPLAEERARIETRDRVIGRVRVTTRTREEEVPLAETLLNEQIEVRRVPIDRPVDFVPEIREEDGVTIIPVVEEVLVKRLVLREEVHLHRTVEARDIVEPVKLRVQDAVVERLGPDESDE